MSDSLTLELLKTVSKDKAHIIELEGQIESLKAEIAEAKKEEKADDLTAEITRVQEAAKGVVTQTNLSYQELEADKQLQNENLQWINTLASQHDWLHERVDDLLIQQRVLNQRMVAQPPQVLRKKEDDATATEPRCADERRGLKRSASNDTEG